MEHYRIGKPWIPTDNTRKWEDVKSSLLPAEVAYLEQSGVFPVDESDKDVR